MPELLAFYFLPAQYMDPSWWQSGWLSEELFERLRQNVRSQRHLSSFFLKQTGSIDHPTLDCEPALAKLALLPGRRLMRLVSLAGITLLSTTIARVLHSRDKSLIKSKIGDKDYEFAVKRGRFLLQQARLKQAMPAVSLSSFDLVGEDCHRLGVGGLATALQEAPAPWIHRVQWKLPKTLTDQYWQVLMPRSEEFLRLFRLLNQQDPPA